MGSTDTPARLRRARLVGEKVYLRALEQEDVNDEYLNWLNDISINNHIRGAARPVSMLDLEEQFENAQKRSNEVNFAVCDLESGIHIGNLRVRSIELYHRSANIGRLLGHPDFQGGGRGSEALFLGLKFGFYHLGLNRIETGVKATNIAAVRSNEKIGMTMEGVKRQAVFWNGTYYDVLHFSMLRHEFEERYGTPDECLERELAIITRMSTPTK